MALETDDPAGHGSAPRYVKERKIMTFTIIFAIAGWGLFALVVILYYVGNRLNNQETNALAVYSLALLLSDDFRSATLSGFAKAIQEVRSNGISAQDVTYGLMQGVTQNAKRSYNNEEAPVNTISIVIDAINKSI
jgi:hypothetical protein